MATTSMGAPFATGTPLTFGPIGPVIGSARRRPSRWRCGGPGWEPRPASAPPPGLPRPRRHTPEQIRHARDLLTRPENTVASIARLLGVSRNTRSTSTCPRSPPPELYPTPTYPPRRRQPHELIATPATAPAPGPRRDFSCRWSSRAKEVADEPVGGAAIAPATPGSRSDRHD